MALGRGFTGIVLAIGVIGLTSGCSNLLEVDLPGVVEASSLDNPALSTLLVESAIASFECAYTHYTAGSSAQSDELWHISGGQIYREWGGRWINGQNDYYVRGECTASGYGNYVITQTARFLAKDAYEKISSFPAAEVTGDPTELMATASAYEGYSLLLLGEQYCTMAIDGGAELQPSAVMSMAEEKFQRAIQTGSADIKNMASVGLGRALRAKGDLAGAAAAVSSVPEGFDYGASRDDSDYGRRNLIYNDQRAYTNFTVAPTYRGVTWKGDMDPRVETFFQGIKPEYGAERWSSTKYSSQADPIPLATWDEAQLIIAENAGGQTAVDIINAFHTRAGLQPFDPAVDIVAGPSSDNIQNMVIETRRRELFLEGGHRLADLNHYNMAYPGKTPGDVDHLGRQYGSTTCWPLPDLEKSSNPNIG